ncbi:TIGR02117 family protein [Rhizobium rhizogenes]|uniref:TIGR02117 family protein n=1 Tax=Rhizobium rhizogenes TaxID=359 RepID=UPI000647845B|nr:TIGR02117 family protein [Rhizobium rhizogenes]NTI42413.1 TIGR02117 family protein [Rhizobium rhizogenes]OCJ13513.1 urease-associated protein [Agrobacterium sp. B131/95]QRM38323.1 TIGR02117 family protein [Rhizobium rhizogenes]
MGEAIRWLFRLVLLAVLAVAGGTFIPRPLFAPAKAADEVAATRRILVLSNPIHTDIAVPLNDETRAAFSFLGQAGVPLASPDAEWLIFGWGGRAFYLETPHWADLKPMPVLRALTLDSSVLHVDVAGHLPEQHPAVQAFDINSGEFKALLGFVAGSFEEQSREVMPVADAAYGVTDRFFEAKGYFNLLFGCNTWTAAALRTAGIKTGLWNPVPETLKLSLALYN